MNKKRIYKLACIVASLHAGAVFAADPTFWTSWLNRDGPGGNGDFENKSGFTAAQVCASPTAIEARIAGTTTIFVPGNTTPHKLSNFSPADGLICQNVQQVNGAVCGDYEVRFNCPPPSIATNPSVVIKKVTTAKLPALRDGKNSVAFVELTPESRIAVGSTRFTLDVNGQSVFLNDLREGLDATSGDGIFTGLTNVDETEMVNNDSFFQRKLQAQPTPQVVRFDGRSVLGRRGFTPVAKAPTTTVVLADGTQARLMDSVVGNSGELPALTNAAHTLAINDPRVVAHPSFTFDPCNTDAKNNNVNSNASWSFKTLISNLNNSPVTGLTNQQFAHNWLINWFSNNTVNGFNIGARPNIKQYFPGWDGVNAATLNMDRLPFRLLAITNRMDLAKSSAYGISNQPGETRFVFGILQLNQTACTNGGIPSAVNNMTVIFEFGDTATTCSTQQSRAKQWLELDALAGAAVFPQVGANIGSAAYMSALKVITDAVTVVGANRLNQLRTNDFAFDGVGSVALRWQLREFAIDSTTRRLVPATIKQTPDPVQFRDGSNVMAAFAEQNANAVLCESYSVPAIFNGAPFLGASADYTNNTAWVIPTLQTSLPANFPVCYKSSITASDAGLTKADLIQSEVRHKFSLNTCDDCHAAETRTFFTHINSNRSLSGFMTGISVSDPALGTSITREFNDLARRNQVLSEMSVQSCNAGILRSRLLKNARLNMIH